MRWNWLRKTKIEIKLICLFVSSTKTFKTNRKTVKSFSLPRFLFIFLLFAILHSKNNWWNGSLGGFASQPACELIKIDQNFINWNGKKIFLFFLSHFPSWRCRFSFDSCEFKTKQVKIKIFVALGNLFAENLRGFANIDTSRFSDDLKSIFDLFDPTKKIELNCHSMTTKTAKPRIPRVQMNRW